MMENFPKPGLYIKFKSLHRYHLPVHDHGKNVHYCNLCQIYEKKNIFCKSLIQNPKVSYLRNVIKINPINFLEEKNLILVSLFSSCN